MFDRHATSINATITTTTTTTIKPQKKNSINENVIIIKYAKCLFAYNFAAAGNCRCNFSLLRLSMVVFNLPIDELNVQKCTCNL